MIKLIKLRKLKKHYIAYNTCNDKFINVIDEAIIKEKERCEKIMLYGLGFLFGVGIAYLEFRKAF